MMYCLRMTENLEYLGSIAIVCVFFSDQIVDWKLIQRMFVYFFD